MFLFNKISLWITIYFHEVGTSDTEMRRTFCDAKGAFLVGEVEKGISVSLQWSVEEKDMLNIGFWFNMPSTGAS